jgi:hypothetical protein
MIVTLYLRPARPTRQAGPGARQSCRWGLRRAQFVGGDQPVPSSDMREPESWGVAAGGIAEHPPAAASCPGWRHA